MKLSELALGTHIKGECPSCGMKNQLRIVGRKNMKTSNPSNYVECDSCFSGLWVGETFEVDEDAKESKSVKKNSISNSNEPKEVQQPKDIKRKTTDKKKTSAKKTKKAS